MDLENKTKDELEELRRQINSVLSDREKEPAKGIFIVRLNDSESGATYFKNYDEAIKEFNEEVDFSTLDFMNKMSIEYAVIPESEYNLRPDRWYS